FRSAPLTTTTPAESPPTAPAQSTPAEKPSAPTRWPIPWRLSQFSVIMTLAGVALGISPIWWFYRIHHSITEDAFVEAHIVNIAPQSVSGHLVRFLVQENDRVEQDQVLAEIDPSTYSDETELARSKVA